MYSVAGCGLADDGAAVVAEDEDRGPLDRLAVRGTHRPVVGPPAENRLLEGRGDEYRVMV
jgi:hypothetical protein